MAYLDVTHISCGIAELYSLDTYVLATKTAVTRQYHTPQSILIMAHQSLVGVNESGNVAMILFSDVVDGDDVQSPVPGSQLAAYITKEKLGTIWQSPEQHNPNTDNTIVLWVWTVNKGAWDKWMEKSLQSTTSKVVA